MAFIPTVIEQSHRGERGWDLYSRLLRDRIVFLGDAIDHALANSVVAQLLFLESEDIGKDIMLYINSPGGELLAGLAIYDTMNHLTSPVATFCVGQASSMAALILAAGAAGKRAALPHSRVMIHQPLGGVNGQASDIAIHAHEIVRARREFTELMSRHTGQPFDRVRADIDRDHFLSAREAADYGIVDRILEPEPA